MTPSARVFRLPDQEVVDYLHAVLRYNSPRRVTRLRPTLCAEVQPGTPGCPVHTHTSPRFVNPGHIPEVRPPRTIPSHEPLEEEAWTC